MGTTIIVGLVAVLVGGAGSYFYGISCFKCKSRNLLKEAEVQSEIIKEKEGHSGQGKVHPTQGRSRFVHQ